MPDLQVGAARETRGDEVAVLGPKFPNTPGVLFGFLGDISQFFRGKNLPDVLYEIVQETFLASYVASSDSIGYVPATCGVEVRLGVHEHVLVRFEVDASFGIGRSAGGDLVTGYDSQFADAARIVGDSGKLAARVATTPGRAGAFQ